MQDPDKTLTAYLFAYFTGNARQQEAIHFALSEDGYRYRALHGNRPVLESAEISSSGGVRDPHVLRGTKDNLFYMVATDMVSEQGWESNRAMILLKSIDLINWTSAVVNIQARFHGNENLFRVWAPQTMYDPVQEKYMIYWSMKHGEAPDKIYYAYANADFTDLENQPQQLFVHPQEKACIDGDILYKDGRYYLFFKTHEEVAGIQVAVAESLTGDYVLRPGYVHQSSDPAEGSCIFKFNNRDEYMFMYDLYMTGKYQFTRTTDLEKFEVIDEQVSLDFTPRHGSILPLTSTEARRLIKHWDSQLLAE